MPAGYPVQVTTVRLVARRCTGGLGDQSHCPEKKFTASRDAKIAAFICGVFKRDQLPVQQYAHLGALKMQRVGAIPDQQQRREFVRAQHDVPSSSGLD
jgi:hypothetical protein